MKVARAGYSAYIPHERVPYVNEGPSMTRQEFADECDINKLMERYEGAGGLPPPPGTAFYLDAADLPDNYMDVMNIMNDAGNAFMTLPAKVRKEFDNDPTKFVEFALNKDNLAKMREWGLAPEEAPPPPPQRVEIVNPPKPEASEVPPASGGA